ncbi:PKD domain-containing protein [Desulfobulbus sp.]|uniref:PKD domain-containing protein n=1 Tax=Desulfobulbus sp. TaxID=895 RepID=UPI00286EB5CC|nr:PKD domain-containing protein [Desulfobulbus sp.]
MARIVHLPCKDIRVFASSHAVITMYTRIIRLFLLLSSIVPGLALATPSIRVEWGYIPPAIPSITAFHVYANGKLLCTSENADAISMECPTSLPVGTTTSVTLTVTFADETESPHSDPIEVTVTEADIASPVPDPPTIPSTVPPNQTPHEALETTGSKLFTFNWATPTDTTNLKGYRIYLNSALLCETTNTAATTISCKADLIHNTMTFSVVEITANGSESSPSNLLVFDPTAYPELFNTKQLSFSWEYNQTSSIKGFRIYQNSNLICQINDPNARQLTCTADLMTTPAIYTLTSIDTNDIETSFSNALTYTGSTDTITKELKAAIAANTVAGPAPLPVTFDASASTGSVTSYQWDFGDGSTSTTASASHTYATAGTYTAKLTVVNSAGATNTTTIAITASRPAVVEPTPPTAVVSTSIATGPAPLTVSFDGSGSTATNTSIASYSWSFGDGASSIGASAAHTYTSAGTYTATLTVTDSKGQSGRIDTPVIVSAPVAVNKAPQAVISATPTNGLAPLTVTFDGGGSSDSDGTISTYIWNFGDGSTASGKSVSHTYTLKASFAATLQVTDDKGATGISSVAIATNVEPPPPTEVKIETGEVAVSSEWIRVPLSTSFTNPIVVAGPPSFNNGEPCTVRIRNVNKTGFDIKLTEWNYLDGIHPQETISYLVMERGHYTLPSGAAVEAGSFTGATNFKTVPFTTAFAKAPVVLANIASMNETDTVSGRIKNITASNFSYYYREQEQNTNSHLTETVNYIAWELSTGTIGSLQYEVGKTANSVTNVWYSGKYQSGFNQAPLLLADMQTSNDLDTSALRVKSQTAAGFQIMVEEEQSKDKEVAHPAETVGYIALDQPSEKTLATFYWEFDSVKESAIRGFQVLINGEVICTSDSPSDRQLSCETTKPTGQIAFTIQAINTTGSPESTSNTIFYVP